MPGAFLGTHPHSQVLPALLEVEAELVSLAQCGVITSPEGSSRARSSPLQRGAAGNSDKKIGANAHFSHSLSRAKVIKENLYSGGFFSDHKSFKAPFVSCLGALQTGWLPTRNSAVFLPQTLLHKGMNCAQKNDGFSLSGVSLPLQ